LAGFAAIAVACAVGGFALGRRQAYAATAIRGLDSEPEPLRARPLGTVTKPSAQREPPEANIDLALVTRAMPPGTNVGLGLESGPSAQSLGLSSKVLFEMDQALDNTRSMFTDVDRFIALGRTQDAISLLQFQVLKDPKNRDSWIKLMAIYRREKMDSELAAAAREFKRDFPADDSPTG
jgi:hypothetical protein